MKVLDEYQQIDKMGKERYKGTKFILGDSEYLGKSHDYSYLLVRKLMQEAGEIMGLDKKLPK